MGNICHKGEKKESIEDKEVLSMGGKLRRASEEREQIKKKIDELELAKRREREEEMKRIMRQRERDIEKRTGVKGVLRYNTDSEAESSQEERSLGTFAKGPRSKVGDVSANRLGSFAPSLGVAPVNS